MPHPTFLLLALALLECGCASDTPAAAPDRAPAAPAAAPPSSATRAPGGSVSAACWKEKIHQCTDYLAPMTEKAEALCGKTHGVVSKDGTPCPAVGLVGTCSNKNFDDTLIDVHSYTGAPDPEGVCKLTNGNWKPV